jgi:hypothetical protein
VAIDVGLQLYLSGAWTSVPLLASRVRIRRGLDPFGSWPRPSQFVCEIDNDTLDYDPTRPASLLYGVAGRNTRARIRPHGVTRIWAESSSWEPEATPEHVPGARKGRSGTVLTAEGLLRRLGKWTDPLRSPMYRTLSGRTTSVGHWSLEDDSGALLAANSLAAGKPARIKGDVSLADDEAPLGAEQSARMTAGAAISGDFVSASATAGWQIAMSFRLPAMPASGTYGTLLQWTTSNGYTWFLQVNSTTYRMYVLDSESAVKLSSVVSFGAKDPTRWTTMRIKVSQSGGTVTVEPAWYEQGDTNEVGWTDTFSGTIGRLTTFTATGNSWNDGGWFSHIHGVTGTTDSLVGPTAQRVFNGYLGETAAERYFRLMSEAGLTRYAIGTSSLTPAMGPQRADTLLNLLREIRETDGGRIDDERLDIALTAFWRNALYNQAPALELTYPGDISPPFRGRLADDGVANRVTVKNSRGGEVTVERATGPMSVQAPPSGVGEYRAEIDVNVADENTLPDRANWELARGTLERPVYDAVVVDVVANPALLGPCSIVREGNMITVDGYEPELIRLLVVGIEEAVTPGTHTFTFLVEPYEVFHVGEWDDPSWRWDSRTSTLQAGVSSSATSIVIEFTDRQDFWSTAAGYDIVVAGERMTVSAMGAVTGSGPWTQTATVVRAVNGVSKEQDAGAEVHVADARRWAL